MIQLIVMKGFDSYGNDSCSSCYDYLCVEMTAVSVKNDGYSSCHDYLCVEITAVLLVMIICV